MATTELGSYYQVVYRWWVSGEWSPWMHHSDTMEFDGDEEAVAHFGPYLVYERDREAAWQEKHRAIAHSTGDTSLDDWPDNEFLLVRVDRAVLA
jgi:hypothetical protein